MAPSKRKKKHDEDEEHETTNLRSRTKRTSKSDIEKHICQKRLAALAHEESQSNDDRFSFEEKKRLLDAFNEHGYHVFENTKLLHQYFPARREIDLKGLMQRLKVNCTDAQKEISQPIVDWQRLCQQLMGSFAKSRHINLDDIFSDALNAEADESISLSRTTDCDTATTVIDDDMLKPDFSKLTKSFAQLLQGRFPDNMNPINAQISMKLFEHVNSIVDSIDLKKSHASILDGTWLDSVMGEKRSRLDMALKGLDEIDGTTKKCPTLRDIEKNRDIEALCLELPKIKRITDVLNPLNVSELEILMDKES